MKLEVWKILVTEFN